MSAEERWMERQEWAHERATAGIEVKRIIPIPPDLVLTCEPEECSERAIQRMEVGLESFQHGALFDFCAKHSAVDFAIEFYIRMRE